MKIAASAVALALLSRVALAIPMLGTDSLVQNPLVGVTCSGDLAVGVTCNNNVSLSGTGQILFDGDQTGDFVAIPSGVLVSDVQLISSVLQPYSFTSPLGSFSGVIQSVTLGGFGNLTSLTDFLTGTWTPALGGFDPGPASLVMAYTEAKAPGIAVSFSVSDTLASPIDVPEPASTLALISVALVAFVMWRKRVEKHPRRISASAI